MKSSKIRFYGIVAILIAVLFLGCKKPDEKEEIINVPVTQVEVNTGTTVLTVDIPDNMLPENIEITNFSQTENLSNAQNLSIFSQTNVLAAINKSNGEIIYIGMFGKDATKDGEGAEMVLNSRETAIYLILQSLPVPYASLTPDKLAELKTTIEGISGFDDFVALVTINISEHGYMFLETMTDAFLSILQKAKDCAGIFGLDLSSEFEAMLAMTGDEAVIDPNAPFFKVNEGAGFRADIKSAVFNEVTQKWKLNCTFYSRKPLTFGITKGTKDAEGIVSYNKDSILHMLKPFNASSFYKSFSSCSGVANYFGDIRRAIIDGAEADITFDMAETKNIEVEISGENDVLCVVAPSANLRVGLANIARMLTSSLMLFNKPESQGEFDKFVSQLITSSAIQEAATTTQFQFDYDNFKALTGLVLKELETFLGKKEPAILQSIVYETLDADGLDQYMKKVKFFIKVTRVSIDLLQASATWQQSKSFYFEFAFPLKEMDAYLNPVANAIDIPISTDISLEWHEQITENDNNIQSGQVILYEYNTWTQIPLIDKNYQWTGMSTIITYTPEQELQPDTKYFVLVQPKAFRDEGGLLYEGISNRDRWSFSTNNEFTGNVTDIEGNIYKTVKIGNQWWMAENLKTTRYADDSAMINGAGAGIISGDYTTKYYFAYDNNDTNVETYGRLYTWAAAMNGSEIERSQGACPNGWHLPSDDEWKELEIFLGMSQTETDTWGWRGTNEGKKLKSTDDWYNNGNGTNEIGFKALPAGKRQDRNGLFVSVHNYAHFWSSTLEESKFAWERELLYSINQINRVYYNRSEGFSVRCIQN